MKNIVAALALVGIVNVCQAQKSNIQSASNSLRNKEYKDAIEYIDKAIKDPSTMNDHKAWYVRGNIYLAMQQDPGYAAQKPYKEGVTSLLKVVEIKSDYETDMVNRSLAYGAQMYYNESVDAYNNKKYSESYELAKKTVDIHNLGGGKRFANNKGFDTVAAGAATIQAYSAFYNNDYDKALPALEQLKANPIEGNNANVYLIIIDVYRKQGNNAKEIATIEEAKAKFPTNPSIKNEELNYYKRTNQQDVFLKKMEDALAADPSNVVYQYNLANAYTNMAFPKKADGTSATKPANYSELITKAEAGFLKAIASSPDNMGYHYDMGVLYFNQASEVTDRMNQVTGTSAEEDKKYNELKKQRDDFFAKAAPHLEQVYTTLEPKLKDLNGDDKLIYQSSLIAMREIYARQNKLDKAAELKAKMEAIK